MRGQWVDYNNFNLVELIDELKTRLPIVRASNILKGMMVGDCSSDELECKLRGFLEDDDKLDSKKVLEFKDVKIGSLFNLQGAGDILIKTSDDEGSVNAFSTMLKTMVIIKATKEVREVTSTTQSNCTFICKNCFGIKIEQEV